MMQAPQGMHMTHPRPSEWGGGGNSGHDGRGGGGVGYDLSGKEKLQTFFSKRLNPNNNI